jgi:hypothetical protein
MYLLAARLGRRLRATLPELEFKQSRGRLMLEICGFMVNHRGSSLLLALTRCLAYVELIELLLLPSRRLCEHRLYNDRSQRSLEVTIISLFACEVLSCSMQTLILPVFWFSSWCRFSRHTRQWFWRFGSSPSAPVQFNDRGVFNLTTTPGGRYGACGAVDPASGDLFFTSGRSSLSSVTVTWGDTFRYSISRNQWQWSSGLNIPAGAPSYDAGKGVAISGATSGPGARLALNW